MSKPIALLLPFEEPKEGNDTAGNSLKGETTFVVDRFTLHEVSFNLPGEDQCLHITFSCKQRCTHSDI